MKDYLYRQLLGGERADAGYLKEVGAAGVRRLWLIAIVPTLERGNDPRRHHRRDEERWPRREDGSGQDGSPGKKTALWR